MGRDYLQGVLLFFCRFTWWFFYIYIPRVCVCCRDWDLLHGYVSLGVWVFGCFSLFHSMGWWVVFYLAATYFCPSSEGTMMDGWAGKIAMFSGQVQVSRRRRRERDTSRRDWVGTVQICVHTRASSG